MKLLLTSFLIILLLSCKKNNDSNNSTSADYFFNLEIDDKKFELKTTSNQNISGALGLTVNANKYDCVNPGQYCLSFSLVTLQQTTGSYSADAVIAAIPVGSTSNQYIFSKSVPYGNKIVANFTRIELLNNPISILRGVMEGNFNGTIQKSVNGTIMGNVQIKGSFKVPIY